jgi:hypothetical protein
MAPALTNPPPRFTRVYRLLARTDRPAAIVVLGACAYWIAFRIYTGICLEDALITYRYAENLAGGVGFVFNEGERVLGTTTPLQTLMLAGPGALLGPAHIPLLSNIFMMLSGLGAGGLLYGSLVQFGYSRRLALVCMAVLLYHPDIVWSATGGMETPLVLFLMALGLYAAAVRNWGLMGLACGLLIMARIDGLIWCGCLFLATGMNDKHALRIVPAVVAVVLVPWIVFSTIYFGNPVPHSMLAKMHHLGAPGPLDRLGTLDLRLYYRWFADGAGVSRGGGILPFEHMIWLGLVTLGGIGVIREHWRSPLMTLVWFPLLYCAAFVLGGAPTTFRWYLMPFMWCCVALGVIGIRELWLILAAYGQSYGLPRWAPRLMLGVNLAMIGTGLVVTSWSSTRFHRDSQANENATRRGIGEWLREHTADDATVAMEALGYQGALSRRTVYDLAGLISPDVLTIRRQSAHNGEVYRRVLEEMSPDYLVLRSFEVDEGTARGGGRTFETSKQRADFFLQYEEIRRYAAPYPELWGNNAHLTLFGKKTRR